MKNTMKIFVVACVAAISLGVHNETAEAIMGNRVEKEDSIQKLGQQYRFTNKVMDVHHDMILNNAWVYNREVLQPQVLSIPPLEPKIEIIGNALELLAEQTEPELEKASDTAEPEAPSTEPEIDTAEDVPAAPPAVSISNEEKNLFARLVEAEAKGESFEGKTAVATVVLNRVDSADFPNTITEVINEVVGDAYAFSPVQNGEIKKPASDEAIRAVDEALRRTDRLNDSIYFYNPEIATDDWIRSREVVKTIGNHVFAK